MPIDSRALERRSGLEEQAERMGRNLAREAFGKEGWRLDSGRED